MENDQSILDIIKHFNGGYWSLNQKHFYIDKTQCLRDATSRNSSDVKFHYYDDFYTKLPKIEPTQTLKSLYLQRAIQLREKYDYIALAYSGGSDSHNILKTFLDNNIHIDEIITFYPIEAIDRLLPQFDISDDSAQNMIFEYSAHAAPILQNLSNRNSSIKITILDYTRFSIDFVLNNKLMLLPLGGVGLSPHNAGHYMLAERMKKIADNNQNYCMLTGVDKPRLGCNNSLDKWAAWFEDTIVWGNYTDESHNGFKPLTENFYYTTDLPEIWLKQIHVLKHSLTAFITDFNTYTDLYQINQKGNYIFNVHHIFCKKALYSDWKENYFQTKKQTSFFYPEHNNWFFTSGLVESKAIDYHRGQLTEFIHGIHPQWLIWNNTIPKNFKIARTKLYRF